MPRILPLYLTPLEMYFWIDDRDSYPMTFVIQMKLRGTLHRDHFEQSLGEALVRHPLLRAHVRPAKAGRPCWVSAHRLPWLDWSDAAQPLLCPRGERIRLDEEVGLRIWVRPWDLGQEITLQFHHACCDGIGAYRFIGDWLALYGQRTAPRSLQPELQSNDLRRLRDRGRRCSDVAHRGSLTELLQIAWRELHGLFGWRDRPVPLFPPPGQRTNARESFPGIYSLHLSRSEHDALRVASVREGATVNDLLLAELFMTLQQWNQQHGKQRKGRSLRIMMPVDLRETADHDMPAANLIGCAFLNCAANALTKRSKSLADIRDETLRIRSERRGIRFNDALAAATYWRWPLPVLLRGQTCLATAIMSNVGDPTKRFTARFPREAGRVVMGNLQLDDITGVPPLRPRTRVTFSISSYQRRLSISARCSPHHFSIEHTGQLTNDFATRLRRWTSHAAPEPANGSRS